MFTVGQRVVCIFVYPARFPHETMPVLNKVYTVRTVEWCLHYNCEAVRLAEIVNPPFIYAEGMNEVRFPSSHFRPVVERKTDISIFMAMLTPQKRTVDA